MREKYYLCPSCGAEIKKLVRTPHFGVISLNCPHCDEDLCNRDVRYK